MKSPIVCGVCIHVVQKMSPIVLPNFPDLHAAICGKNGFDTKNFYTLTCRLQLQRFLEKLDAFSSSMSTSTVLITICWLSFTAKRGSKVIATMKISLISSRNWP